MSDQDQSFGAFLVGIVVGGLVGAAVALLYAPQSGLETRTYIKDKSIELKDKAAETVEEARVRTEQALEDARVRADAALSDVKSRADELSKLTKRQKVVLEEQETGTEVTPPAEPAAAA
jgi:gas vesicle protein